MAAGVLTYAHRELPLKYYSRERLYSPEARFGFLDPDLIPLDSYPGEPPGEPPG